MTRQMMRLRPPAEEDLQPTAEEEMHLGAEIAVGTKKQMPPLQGTHPTGSAHPSHADHAPGDRSSYFVGRYAQAAPAASYVEHKKAAAIVDGLLSEFSLPETLRPHILHLIHVMREQGIAAVQAAIHQDETIHSKYVPSILRLLARLARHDL